MRRARNSFLALSPAPPVKLLHGSSSTPRQPRLQAPLRRRFCKRARLCGGVLLGSVPLQQRTPRFWLRSLCGRSSMRSSNPPPPPLLLVPVQLQDQGQVRRPWWCPL